ncbi:MAG: ferrochelatase [Alphaproteobacteria bacterium]|nr:ferrochelatase [Alphaproteobacteria bacterium]
MNCNRGFDHFPSDHPPVSYGRIGILLVNLGTPEGTDYWSMRRYLKEFLSDRRVINVNPFLWWLLLNAIILTIRPNRSGHAYKQIWDQERNESPLRGFTRSQAEKLFTRFSKHDNVIVDWAMRYGQPSIDTVLQSLRSRGCTRILFFPLYPQYSVATTATANDALFRSLLKMYWQPALRIVPPYYDDPIYIDALVKSLKSGISVLDFDPEYILISFHGLPRSYLDQGDPYHCHCMKTARLLRESMGWTSEKLIVSFQSRFGWAPWLTPYTDETIKRLAGEGVKKLAVITPGFVSDCVETLEEIAIQNRDFFLEYGGLDFAFIPCLNDGPIGMDVIEYLVCKELSGWL